MRPNYEAQTGSKRREADREKLLQQNAAASEGPQMKEIYSWPPMQRARSDGGKMDLREALPCVALQIQSDADCRAIHISYAALRDK